MLTTFAKKHIPYTFDWILNMALSNTAKKLSHLKDISPDIKLFASLFLSGKFCFVAQMRKNMLQKEVYDWTFEVIY